MDDLEDEEESYGSVEVKRKKRPAAKKAPPASASAGNKKSGLELKKRPSEVTAQTVVEDASYVDAEDQVIGGGFTSFDEILDARPYFIKEDLIKDL